MHIHILGICGTFMGGIALLAKQRGISVSGSDQNVYPPMSTQLEEQGIELIQGFDPKHIPEHTDCVVVGNAMSRGNPSVEYVLEQGLTYRSGPQWLAENIIHDKWVLAASGTHGKTTTASMLAWILEYANLNPGFLIGGVPENFGLSARVTESPFFVVEADEYDTAFFDKRSKFVHYRPRTLIMNNLEYDHADIFPNLEAIKTQFHHLLRIVPGNGLVIYPKDDANLQDVVDRGLWSGKELIGDEQGWQYTLLQDDGGHFEVYFAGQKQGEVNWPLIGLHNVNNALAAIAAARHAGVPAGHCCDALAEFRNVKRRMELKGEAGGVKVYDDFAHHPTAVKTTLDGFRAKVGQQRVIAIVDLRSATMRSGIHKDTLLASLKGADQVIIHKPAEFDWQFPIEQVNDFDNLQILPDVDSILNSLKEMVQSGDNILVMSNGGFGAIHQKLLQQLAA
ncbi:UDP-N-acetylmuramate:L-alanyl-gamma-D-glutamyl-meso-diaminopimelate ligase [Kangiella aquimarina]|uniref:UDP-N-acetylmuramate--L-alanyl-gamma-D-glutamyl-meso-2,6-diaminoheptandioate ligase n=1 Tax=Kangiella aquimarina TaxID=261965 RepID=A0ABZ0X492_9GAMM|nr:UDP-N-acetylmuramate:L-alanyl-gamma-D-glutamyl-meso-diaminopimelate ligase [Kangiella aquimarina]WQG85107.1 UDP-N-acetylmuramate:L-alanyl-gamma-D-glutamyl-meso-diaminopimelate ligase [Kangiella aquimarina]